MITIVNHFALGDYGNSSTPPLLFAIDIFFLQYYAVIGHVLVIERVLATVFVRCYETFRKTYFSIAWVIVLVFFRSKISI
jgi:hypothetical protein